MWNLPASRPSRASSTRLCEQARRGADAIPTTSSISLLADLLERAGRPAEAREQRATVAVIDRLLEANGIQVDLESAVTRADNLVRPRETVELARRARAARPSIYGDDALAWALARAGRCAEAVPLARRALRLGTEDGLLYFHLGYAEGCAGDRSAMRDAYRRALEVNEAFSVRWAPVARAALGNALANVCIWTAGYAALRESPSPTRRLPRRACAALRGARPRIVRWRRQRVRGYDLHGDDDCDRDDHNGDDHDDETTPPPPPGPTEIRIVVVNGAPKGGIVREKVAKGDRVVLIVRSDVTDHVHLHGYDIMRDVAPGKPARLPFKATIPGRFEVELEDRGVPIADITVSA